MRPALLLGINNGLPGITRGLSSYPNPKYVNQARSGKENFEKDFERTHVTTSLLQKFILGLGSGILSISTPSRGDMVAVMGEVTGPRALEYIRVRMLESEEGRKILEEKPRISSATVDLETLKSYPEGTLGKAYSNFLHLYGYSPDSRNSVRFVDDKELAYVAQRYREVHDLFHTIFHMPTNMLGEVTVKWVEAIQTRLPMCITGALFGPVRLAPKLTRTYSTKVVLRIDSEMDSKIKNKELNPKHHTGVMNVKCVELPVGVKEGILSEVALNNICHKQVIKHGLELERRLWRREVPPEEHFKAIKKSEAHKYCRNKYFAGVRMEDLDNQMEKKLNRMVDQRLKKLLYNWKRIMYDSFTSFQYLIVRAPSDYATLRRVFNEILLRDKEFKPQSLFDFGSGVGTTLWAANELWGDSLKHYYCVDISKQMNDLARNILESKHYINAPDINKVFFRQFLPASYLPHDIVVSAFTLFELKDCKDRIRTLTTLWNNTSRYLVLIENGTNAGHWLINEARSWLLETSKLYNVECSIFAPCPHELPCPRFQSLGKLTPCNFVVKYHRLPLGSLRRSTGTSLFSFLILRKGEKPPQEISSARIVRKVLRRHKHIVCHLCMNDGKLTTSFFPKKQCESAYACLRQSKWGDVIPEGITLEKQKVIKADHSIIEESNENNEEDLVDREELISDEESDEEGSENGEKKESEK
ncbi:hypothetical protein RUM43_003049 [Polyplax serrata]|uniref:Ubiquinone biosynthesis protein COQ4 homolog, mitochondrial n=1 Tax=Polyplax serrata TaxID=468196 RepID=A0AAN8PNC3_POLSC